MKKMVKKIYRAKLDERKSRIVGWPKPYHFRERKTFWQTLRAMLF